MTLISYLTQKRQPPFFRSAPPPYSHKGFGKLSFKKKAFTLAEVLITLTIIGVVAAMTIPTLMSKYQKHTYLTGLKKAYSQLQNAWKMIPLSEGCPAGDYDCAGLLFKWTGNFYYEPTQKRFEALSKQFKVAKTCLSESVACPDNFEWYSEDSFPYIILNDGTQYAFYHTSIGIDINGVKGPNKIGKDQYYFAIIGDNGSKCSSNAPCGTITPVGSKLFGKNFISVFYWKDAPNLKSQFTRSYLTGKVMELWDIDENDYK